MAAALPVSTTDLVRCGVSRVSSCAHGSRLLATVAVHRRSLEQRRPGGSATAAGPVRPRDQGATTAGPDGGSPDDVLRWIYETKPSRCNSTSESRNDRNSRMMLPPKHTEMLRRQLWAGVNFWAQQVRRVSHSQDRTMLVPLNNFI